MLSIKGVWVRYDGVQALKGVTLEVEQGEIVTLLGANGAGKSTTLRAISGLKHPTAGEIWFSGQRISRMSPEKITRLGIGHAPEGRRVFPFMSVHENLGMGAYWRKDKESIEKNLEEVFLRFPVLKKKLKQKAGTLSGGEQQMLAMGRALMTGGRLLLLDEPSLGLSPILVEEMGSIVRHLNEAGTTILLVEQNAHTALRLAHRGYVLETGTVALSGGAEELLHDERVRRVYLGG